LVSVKQRILPDRVSGFDPATAFECFDDIVKRRLMIMSGADYLQEVFGRIYKRDVASILSVEVLCPLHRTAQCFLSGNGYYWESYWNLEASHNT
jgi:hypothetical protein